MVLVPALLLELSRHLGLNCVRKLFPEHVIVQIGDDALLKFVHVDVRSGLGTGGANQ